MALMTKKTPQRNFNDVLVLLGGQRFDVAPAQDGAKRAPNAVQVRKYGGPAENTPGTDRPVQIMGRPRWLLHGEIARLGDPGNQKFLQTSKVEIPTPTEQPPAIYEVNEE